MVLSQNIMIDSQMLYSGKALVILFVTGALRNS